tara:strand:+ start:1460 stop:1879 length:420 start_codon:yes stop_codon:yes gene_type:complete
MSLSRAINFTPTEPTYAIRIFSSKQTVRPSLQVSQLYRKISEYEFDDNDISPFRIEMGPKWFDEAIAEAIINDFKEYKSSVSALLVHCGIGENRGPATAKALNKIFSLGYDIPTLEMRFPRSNSYVYNTMIDVSKRLRI